MKPAESAINFLPQRDLAEQYSNQATLSREKYFIGNDYGALFTS
jgi:hypothetical protein